MKTEALTPAPCLCPYHDLKDGTRLSDLPELHPILVPAASTTVPLKLVWACLPCCNRLVKAGEARRCIEERG